jgi:hypothetical protein
MTETYSVKLNGEEVARLTGEGIGIGRKVKEPGNLMATEFIDDPKMLNVKRDSKTILVVCVSSSADVTVEKLEAE